MSATRGSTLRDSSNCSNTFWHWLCKRRRKLLGRSAFFQRERADTHIPITYFSSTDMPCVSTQNMCCLNTTHVLFIDYSLFFKGVPPDLSLLSPWVLYYSYVLSSSVAQTLETCLASTLRDSNNCSNTFWHWLSKRRRKLLGRSASFQRERADTHIPDLWPG